jgi:antitoxin component HigA of HigAB toxin-antitoxin module
VEEGIMKTILRTKEIPKTYEELCRLHPPRTIHDDSDYENTLEVIEALISQPKLNVDQTDFMETLTELIEVYEAQHEPIKKVRGIKLLKYLMEENNISKEKLSTILKKDSTLGYKIMDGSRKITVDHAHVLGRYFSVDPGAFI